MIDLEEKAELLECIEILVDAMRRSDPDYVASHQCEHCSGEDWDTAIAAGEDALEANAENESGDGAQNAGYGQWLKEKQKRVGITEI